jgi:hypothetical protein
MVELETGGVPPQKMKKAIVLVPVLAEKWLVSAYGFREKGRNVSSY